MKYKENGKEGYVNHMLAMGVNGFVVQPAYEEGYQVAKILIGSLENINEEPPNKILKCTVNWAESTGMKQGKA